MVAVLTLAAVVAVVGVVDDQVAEARGVVGKGFASLAFGLLSLAMHEAT